jgi:hypothetical protein
LDDHFIEIGWNGVTLAVPAGWHIGRIGSRHLFFEEHGAPAMEIKWNQVVGRFSSKSYLKRLAAGRGRRMKTRFAAWTPPREWRQVLSPYNIEGFSWEAQDLAGRGVIVYCPTCRTATLMQFFIRMPQAPLDVFAGILAGFRDHRGDGLRLWSLFDIRATLSERYALVEYAFHPGNFTLVFKDRHQSLTLSRWAPAGVLLNGSTLAEFASKTLNLAPEGFTPCRVNGCAGVHWQTTAAYVTPGWLGRWVGAPRFRQDRLWHVGDRNRILGVCLEDRFPADGDPISGICSSYEAI